MVGAPDDPAVVSGALTTELERRPSRAPNHAAEVATLIALAKAQLGPREHLLQALADAALTSTCAGSAGVSLLEPTADGEQVFKWLAVSGACAPYIGKSTARGECPCGVTLDLGVPQLFIDPARHFDCLREAGNISEGLVVPIPGAPDARGALWVMSHSDTRRFEREDVRLLENLAIFTGAALACLDARQIAVDNAAQAQAAHALLEQTEARRNEFIAMLGHELRNPMSPIDGAIRVARRLSDKHTRVHEVLTVAQRQMRHLRVMVDDLLDAARLQHGKLAIRKTHTSFNEIVSDAVTAVRHRMEARKHQFSVLGLEEPIYVFADHVRLSQVLGNLLSNAAKYTPPGGHIELLVTQVPAGEGGIADGASSELHVTIRDNGVGISPDVLPHVFELFAQAPQSIGRSEGGLGIGLAVAKRMVELHGGTIAIDSRGAGRGTVLSLRLPILDSCAEDRVDGQALVAPTAPMRVLLVDDNIDALEVMQVLLELEGHTVRTASNGQDAISTAANLLPDVAIIDIGMPDMDGCELAHVLRSHPEFKDTVLIALTGYSGDADKSRALSAGFDHHFVKPLSLDKLRAVLAHCGGRESSPV